MIDVVLIEQCKNPNVTTELVRQIIRIESAAKPYIININGKASINFKNKKEAILKTKKAISKGLSVDMGLMQVNSKNLKTKSFGSYTVDDMFDPCKNIRLGSDIFYLAYKNTNSMLNHNARVKKALSVYNTGSQIAGFKNGYVAKYNNLHSTSLRELALSSNTKININFKFFNLNSNKFESAVNSNSSKKIKKGDK